MRRNWLEWVVFGVSTLAIVTLVGYLAVTALITATPPAISVQGHPDEARSIGAGWELPVTVRNQGGEAAAMVAIEGTASVAGETESAQLEIALLGPGTEEELVLRFTGAPEGQVELRVIGFHLP